MSNFEWVIIGWLCMLTIRLFFFKKGEKGEKGDTGSFNNYSHELPEWLFKEPCVKLLDDSEYITKLIKKINSLQIKGGKGV